MAELGEILNQNTVRFERLIAAPIDRVWHYLTEAEGLAAWLMPCDGITASTLVELRGDAPDPDGNYHTSIGTVSEYAAPHRLSYSWFSAPDNQASFVRFELEERGDKVLITLTHSGIDAEWMALVGAGWHVNFERLIAHIESGKALPFDELMPVFTELIGKYTVAIAAAGLVVASATAPAGAQSGSPADAEIRGARGRLLQKYDQVWKDTRELQRQYDSMKHISDADAGRALDELDREIKDKMRDLQDLELDIKDLDRALL